MKLTKKVENEKQIGFICDVCGKEINWNNSTRTDNFNISYTFGYGTKYDNTKISADICDDCLMEIISKIPNATIEDL